MDIKEKLDIELATGAIDEGDHFALMMFAACGGNAEKKLYRMKGEEHERRRKENGYR